MYIHNSKISANAKQICGRRVSAYNSSVKSQNNAMRNSDADSSGIWRRWKLSFHRLYISRQQEAWNRKIIRVPPFFRRGASSRIDSANRESRIVSNPLEEKYQCARGSAERKGKKFAELPEVTCEKTNDRRPNFARRKSATPADPLRR